MPRDVYRAVTRRIRAGEAYSWVCPDCVIAAATANNTDTDTTADSEWAESRDEVDYITYFIIFQCVAAHLNINNKNIFKYK